MLRSSQRSHSKIYYLKKKWNNLHKLPVTIPQVLNNTKMCRSPIEMYTVLQNMTPQQSVTENCEIWIFFLKKNKYFHWSVSVIYKIIIEISSVLHCLYWCVNTLFTYRCIIYLLFNRLRKIELTERQFPSNAIHQHLWGNEYRFVIYTEIAYLVEIRIMIGYRWNVFMN